MSHRLQFIPLRSRSDAGWAEAWELYMHSFPDCERRREEDYDRLFADPAFKADCVRRNGEFVGFLFHWDTGTGCYAEHLAVSPALRGQHIGSELFAAFCERVGRVILEIDPPVDEISIRRRGFYERLGFVTNPYDYIHPSYHAPFHPHPLVLMSRPDPLTKEEARQFADFIRERVMRHAGDDRPRLPLLP